MGSAGATELARRGGLVGARGARGPGARAGRGVRHPRASCQLHAARRPDRPAHPALRRRILHDQLRELRRDLLVRRHSRAHRRRRGNRAGSPGGRPDGARLRRTGRDRSPLRPQRGPPALGRDRDAPGSGRAGRDGAASGRGLRPDARRLRLRTTGRGAGLLGHAHVLAERTARGGRRRPHQHDRRDRGYLRPRGRGAAKDAGSLEAGLGALALVLLGGTALAARLPFVAREPGLELRTAVS
jgi:hypothetical protein